MFDIFASSSIWTTTLVTGLLFLLLYLYYSSAFSYWTKRGVYSYTPLPFFGNLKDAMLLKRHFTHVMSDLYLKTGDHKFVGLFKSSTPMLMVRDLDLIRNVLVRDFQNFSCREVIVGEKQNPLGVNLFTLGGRRWRNLRAKLTPTFTAGKMKMMAELIKECCEEMVSWLQDSAAQEESIEMKEVVAKFATDVIGSCAFGLQMNSMKDPNSMFRTMGRKIFTPNIRNTFLEAIGNFVPTVAKMFPPRMADDKVIEFFFSIARDIISYREKNGITRDDFIQLLINLKKDNLSNEGKIVDNKCFYSDTDKEHIYDDFCEITDSHIAAQCYLFFAAGYETSSTVISCCLYELAMRLDIQEKLAKEVDSVLGKYAEKITYEAIQEMKYMDQVLDETMRKYPPGGVLPRTCTKPYTIPGTNILLEKNLMVLIPVHGLHHDPKYFPEPDKFDPDRFSEENVKSIPQYAYLPFGEGPKICIGVRFGRMQVKSCLTALLSQFQFSICEKTSIPLTFDPRAPVVTTPSEVWLTIKKRPDVYMI